MKRKAVSSAPGAARNGGTPLSRTHKKAGLGSNGNKIRVDRTWTKSRH